ncbi:MAG: hypothetical protein ACRCUX_04810, partial [Beijerinckiaceae bacterium]
GCQQRNRQCPSAKRKPCAQSRPRIPRPQTTRVSIAGMAERFTGKLTQPLKLCSLQLPLKRYRHDSPRNNLRACHD